MMRSRTRQLLIVTLAFNYLIFAPSVSLSQELPLSTFRFESPVITAPVQVGGEEYIFVLDTAASHTVVDTSLTQHFDASIAERLIEQGGNRVELKFFRPTVLRVGNIDFLPKRPVVSMPMALINRALGSSHAIGGILGSEFVAQHILQIDFDTERLTIWPQSTSLDRFEGERVTVVQGDRGFFWVTATIGQRESSFLLYTGAFTTGSLERDLFDRQIDSGDLAVTGQTTIYGWVGGEPARLGRSAAFGVGPFAHQGLIFHEGSQNLLGTYYLMRYKVVFDASRRLMLLEPNEQYATRDYTDLCGIQLLGAEVVSVVPDSIADQAGMQKGDIIVAINGVEVVEIGTSKMRRILELTSSDIQLVVVRNDEQASITLPRSRANP